MTRRRGPDKPGLGKPSLGEQLLRHAGQATPVGPVAATSLPVSKLDMALADLRRREELARQAERCRLALGREPQSLKLHLALADLLERLDRRVEALEAYRNALALEPESAEIRHRVTALNGAAPAPARASDRYVAEHFDSLADAFDERLVHWLEYKGPELTHRACLAALGSSPPAQEILDLGCGTGLNAPPFRPLARRLDGIDLSSRMIGKARERKLYDDLQVGEVVQHLTVTPRRYTLALATELLIYFGDLTPFFGGCARVLKARGLLAATVEAGTGEPYRLNPSGRYAHGESYVRQCALDAGFEWVSSENGVLRQENSRPVEGLVFVARKRGAA